MYPYLVPSNIFASLSLRQLADLYTSVLGDPSFAAECTSFSQEIDNAIRKYAIVPSLMPLAYLGAHAPDDPLYKRSRKFLLSSSNPWYLHGKAAEGQASPHTGKDKIWPMGIILRAMTSQDPGEIRHCLRMLKGTHAGTGFMHEAFHKDDPSDFNRKWFAWANTLFGELIIKISREHPEILAGEF